MDGFPARCYVCGVRFVHFIVPALLIGLTGCAKPVMKLADLDGCYEGQGTPDFMRPRVHWAFRISNGVVVNRAGDRISTMHLAKTGSESTEVSFSPGIYVTVNEHKESTAIPGDGVKGSAHYLWGETRIALADDWGTVMIKTSCG